MKPSSLAAAVMLLACATASAEPAVPLKALARLPVKELTIFKDGHAFLLHQGSMPVDRSGNVVLDYLPSPVLGTFWPYSADKAAKLGSVTASPQKVKVERTALNLRELIEANVGGVATVTELPVVKDGQPVSYSGTILGCPAQSSEELESLSPPYAGLRLPVKGNLLLIKTEQGTTAVPFERIGEVTFKDELKDKLAGEEQRNLLTLKLDWGSGKAAAQAEVGLMYLQKGIRWIPNYKIDVDGKGNAAVKLQATIINELVDVENVTANLVIGVPTFSFKDMPDPMGFQQAVAQLSQHFQADSQTAYALSNAMMSQQARMTERTMPTAPTIDLGPEAAGGDNSKREDLFVFPLKGLSLKKGQRMVVGVAEFTIPYRDVFVLDIPFAPPREYLRNFETQRQAELARLMATPKVMHKLRLTNKSDTPLTTAPAMILKEGKLLGQGMLTYTAGGGSVDLDVTAAMNVQANKTDKEIKRTPNAATWRGVTLTRFDMSGQINIVNFRNEKIDLEVVRNVVGNVDEAGQDGKIEKLHRGEDPGLYEYPHWWGWYSWPEWWAEYNGFGRIVWTLQLEPGKRAELAYAWHCFR